LTKKKRQNTSPLQTKTEKNLSFFLRGLLKKKLQKIIPLKKKILFFQLHLSENHTAKVTEKFIFLSAIPEIFSPLQ